MLQPALLGGLFIGVLSALPFVNVGNCCCCLWIVGGGVFAAYIDQQNTPQLSIGPARGALVGLAAGVVGAVVWLIVAMALESMIAPLQSRFIETMMRDASDMPPEARRFFDMIASRSASPFRYAAGFSLQLFAGLIFSTIGGVIGAAFFRKDVPPALGGTYVPPLPPE